MEQAVGFLSSTQTDVLLVVISVGIHAVFFGGYRIGWHFTGGTKRARPHRKQSPKCEDKELASAKLVSGASSGDEALRLLNVAVSHGLAGKDVLLAAAAAATVHSDKRLAQAMAEQMPAKPQTEVAAAALRLCVGGPLGAGDPDDALLRLYSQHLDGADLSGDAAMERLVAHAAVRRGQMSVLRSVFAAAGDSA